MSKNKPWDTSSSGRAHKEGRERRRVLIFCEDSKSSKYYFDSFPIDRERFELSVLGTGMNTDSLVEAAIRRVRQASKNGVLYSEIWCVFDRDSFPPENYHRAFQLAVKQGIKIAWSNEAFELWYLLHFDYLDTGISRRDYQKKLQAKGLEYDKADKTIYDKVKPYQEIAIKNAKKLERQWHENGKSFPERENPSTSVHKLVEFLNDLAELPSVSIPEGVLDNLIGESISKISTTPPSLEAPVGQDDEISEEQ